MAAALRQICEELGFEKHYVFHSLRKYWASTVAQQGMNWKVMIKMFGHSDFELILSTYYAQNDDARLVAEASKIDFGLGLPPRAKRRAVRNAWRAAQRNPASVRDGDEHPG